MGQLMELFNGEGVAILWLRHSLPSERDPGSDECKHKGLIKMGHVLVWSIFKICISHGKRELPSSLTLSRLIKWAG